MELRRASSDACECAEIARGRSQRDGGSVFGQNCGSQKREEKRCASVERPIGEAEIFPINSTSSLASQAAMA